MNKNLPKNQIFFSIYELWPVGPSIWRENKLSWLKSKIESSSQAGNEVHFLGAPLVEREGVPRKSYVAWLRSLIREYGAHEFVYILHPRESDEFAEQLRRELGIAVLRYRLPYEVELCFMEQRPVVVASWFCSALDNLAVANIQNMALVGYRIPKVKLAKNKRKRQAIIMEAAQQFYARHADGSKVEIRQVPMEVDKSNPRVKVGLLLTSEDDLLVLKATNEINEEMVSFPTLGVRKGERIEDTVTRGLIGIGVPSHQIKDIKEQGWLERLETVDGKQLHEIIIAFSGALDCKLELQSEMPGAEYVWRDKKALLDQLDLPYYMRRALNSPSPLEELCS